MPAISPSRKAAFAILMAVERGHSHSDDLLCAKAVNALSAPDRNLATALVLGTLRWQIRLDHQLRALLKHPNAKLDPEIRIALRLGAFQLLHLDRIPARAAIDESVELAKRSGHRFASGMVNAVLRKLAASSQSDTLQSDSSQPDTSKSASSQSDTTQSDTTQSGKMSLALKEHGFSRATDGQQNDGALAPGRMPRIAQMPALKGTGFSPYIERARSSRALAPEGGTSEESFAELALAESHPAWMVERWASFYGLEAARAICRHGQTQPTLAVRLATPAVEAELIAAGIHFHPGELLTAARTIISGDVTATAAFKEGRVRLQDEGSQLVAEIAGQGSATPARTILDCCAAPGGKTLILAERNPQAHILACESSPERLAQLRQRLAAYADRIECRLADATTLTEDSTFDLALADVPCSGTGTLGRNPEIRHRLHPEDLTRQAERQRAILAAALRAVRPGGRVVYSTCSLEPEENQQIVAAVLAETPNARQIPLESSIESLLAESVLIPTAADRLHRCLTPEGALYLLPGVYHTDGFFIALIERLA